ncbi:MFS transporter [Paenibacillus glucanolyticus]|jgi:CP family cyanate transporter-like MFS transporter|uniref:CynX/NimT family MFS transporter n=1 Tax=Paenibacillus TaxID=44249 RepID=UPI0003E1E186|nr:MULTISPECIES: MFS transporter [Paenibacillus]ANA83009.1 transporter [Paenibacillus glucanolyticus]AVV57903.1 MFS transporter [Paenibacillus glucanolyticus]ETT34697.1 major facilitator superfamily protein [Paenibacillus sp. FSL R5-808]OMF83375.1 transporter [Paenibacillus glucanolyticus]
MTSRTSLEPTTSSTGRTWLIFAGIILIAINLRAAITSVGPLIGIIREDTGISSTMAGMLTTLPLLAFALLSPMAPAMAKKWGLETTLLLSMVVLTFGIGIRSISSPITLLLGTAFLGMAIAVGNVLLPSLVKRDFPRHIGLMTGTYSASMNLLAAIASGVSIPLATQAGLGWQGSLLIWASLSVLALIVWLIQRSSSDKTAEVRSTAAKQKSVLRSPLAWYITLFMGLQSFTFYVNISWLPEILRSQGMDYSAAGWMLSILQFVSLPFSFIIPVLAGRNPNQRVLVTISALSMLTGYVGLLSGMSSLNLLWVMLVGISGGANFSLSLMFFTLRTKTAHEAAALSGMAQSLGYLLAAIGPMLIGFLHDATDGWKVPLMVLSAVVVVLFFFGFGAAKPGYTSVSGESTPKMEKP